MHQLIAKTFGGLTNEYYVRQFLFSLVFPLFFYLLANSSGVITPELFVLLVVNTTLYPYARFAHERAMNFIMGENVPDINPLWLIYWKLAAMAFCWALALFIAPIGLAYLYYRHSRTR